MDSRKATESRCNSFYSVIDMQEWLNKILEEYVIDYIAIEFEEPGECTVILLIHNRKED